MNPLHLRATPNRITYVVTKLGLGGAETQLVELAERMRERGWDPQVVSIIEPDALHDTLDELGIPWVSLGILRGSHHPKSVLRLARAIRAWGPSVVHTHTAPANLIGRAARPLAWAPALVTTAHNLVEGGRGRELAYRLSDRLSNFMTNVSRAAVDRYVREGVTPAHRIEYIPNGIDVTRYAPRPEVGRAKRRELGVPDDAFLWLAVGRLTVQKDYPNLIDAFARIADSNPDARVEIVSDGELRDEIAAMIRERGLGDRMRLLGFRRDVGDLMNAADGFVMSSAWEGLPIVLLESAATGLPMVVTDVGGNHEIVLDGRTGYLAPAHDAAALARQMDRAMSLPRDRWRAMGAAAREHVGATFGMTSIADRWDRIYRGLLAEQGITMAAPAND